MKNTLTKEELIEALNAIIFGNYKQWRMKYPPKKRLKDYEVLLQIMYLLEVDSKEKDDLLFIGIDIEKATRKLINEKIDELGINTMTESERKAFDYGVDLVYSLINIITGLGEDEDFVVLTDDEIGTEYDIEDLVKKDNERRKYTNSSINA